jgi:hypothetical protein
MEGKSNRQQEREAEREEREMYSIVCYLEVCTVLKKM